jgi:hypothetical protein
MDEDCSPKADWSISTGMLDARLSPTGASSEIARLREASANRRGRWSRGAFIGAIAAMATGAVGTAAGATAIEDVAATAALGLLVIGSVAGLCRSGPGPGGRA